MLPDVTIKPVGKGKIKIFNINISEIYCNDFLKKTENHRNCPYIIHTITEESTITSRKIEIMKSIVSLIYGTTHIKIVQKNIFYH